MSKRISELPALIGNLDTGDLIAIYDISDTSTHSDGTTKRTTLESLLSLVTGGVESVVAGTGISVNNTDPENPIVSTTITQYTNEMAQDAVGTILTDSAEIDFTYDDAGNSITASLKEVNQKRVIKRTSQTTTASAPTINTDNLDYFEITAQSGNITSMTTNMTGTPLAGQTLWLAFTATSGTPTVTWGSLFESSAGATLPPSISTTRLDVGFIWNLVTSKWRCVAIA